MKNLIFSKWSEKSAQKLFSGLGILPGSRDEKILRDPCFYTKHESWQDFFIVLIVLAKKLMMKGVLVKVYGKAGCGTFISFF